MPFTPKEEAALRGIIAIYQTKAPGLSNDVAQIAPALYEEWTGDAHRYTSGERVLYAGALYICLQMHTSQADWTPDAAPSLWARNLSAADTPDAKEVPAWVQPDSTNGYAIGAYVTHNGKTWVSMTSDNIWEPGLSGTENVWKEVAA